MIVQCDKCKTKFRIADEKVSEAGVKVRCSRCAHVFMVKRDFGAGSSSSELERALHNAGLTPSSDIMPTVGMAIPSALNQPAGQALPSFPSFRENTSPTYPVPSLVPAAATTKDAMIALGFSSSPIEAEEEESNSEPEPATATFTAASLLPPTKNKKSVMQFEDIDSSRFPPPEPISTFDELFGTKEPATQVGPLPGQTRDHGPKSNPAAPKSNPAAPKSNPAAPKTNPALHTPTPRSNPALAALAAAEVGTPADPLTSPFFPPPTGIPGLGTNTNLQMILQVQNTGSIGLPPEGLVGDIPGMLPPSQDDPFAGLDLEGPQYSGGDLAGEDSQAETRAVLEDSKTPPKPLARIDLGRAGHPHFDNNLATTRVASSMFQDAATADLSESFSGTKRWPTLAGLALGLVITVLAVFGPAGGDLSTFGPEDIVALVVPPISEPIDTSVSYVEPRNAKVTLYPGKNGRQLLVVAGEAFNDGAESIVGVEAVAMVKTGSDVLEQREAWVGLTLDEAALSSIGSPAELELVLADAIRAAKTPVDQQPLAPGGSLPFMVVFPDPPSDLGARAFQVEFRRGSMSARRAQ
jgi:predicted Zn finger-like uncharacterized protein